MEDSGNVFFYAALIVIAFISWVVGKIREAIEAFRERQEYKDRPIRTDIGPPMSSNASPQAPPPQVSQRDRAREAMRETYRALGIPFPEEEQTAPPPPQKPARQVRTSARETKKIVPASAQLTSDERKALKRVQQRKNASAASNSGAREGISGRRSSAGAKTLRRLLRNRNATRQAILLKEILDSPKSLRNDSL
jgi:hypothetical protein